MKSSDIIKIKNDALISSLTDSINETDVYLKLIDGDDWEEIKILRVMRKRSQSALDIIDGTNSAKFAVIAREKHSLGKLPKGSKLDKHHDRIVQALNDGFYVTRLARELKCSSSTLYRYLKKHKIKPQKSSN